LTTNQRRPGQGNAPAGVARRGWLRLLGAGSAVVALGATFWRGRWPGAGPTTVAELDRRSIERIVDLLVPRDETLGAVDLGIDASVFAEMQADPALALVYGPLLAEVDREARVQHRATFLSLAVGQQQEVLQALSAAARTAGAFQQLRNHAMRLYYARPEVWPSLGFAGPPQPAGFVDYTDPPRPRS